MVNVLEGLLDMCKIETVPWHKSFIKVEGADIIDKAIAI